ncbi:MAG: hypothetical protein ACE5GW_06295 [Planctomycetota bacterium]
MTGYHTREPAQQVAGAFDDLPVAVVTGLRQAGKITLSWQEPLLQGLLVLPR